MSCSVTASGPQMSLVAATIRTPSLHIPNLFCDTAPKKRLK